MTSLHRLLELSSYQQALTSALSLGVTYSRELRSSLAGEEPPPDGLASDEWAVAVDALRIAFEVGAREGFDSVREEITRLIPSLTDEQKSTSNELLQPDEQGQDRIKGMQSRDIFLPNLARSLLSIDLQLLDADSDELVRVAPVVTARFDFDEKVGGQEAISFRVPLEALKELSNDLSEVLEKVKALSESSATVSVPKWAMPEKSESEEADD